MKRIANAETVTSYGKSLERHQCQHDMLITTETEETDHGTPSLSACCTFIKLANTPRSVAAAASMMIIHTLSCASGQWYFRRRSTTTTSAILFFAKFQSVEVDDQVRGDQMGIDRLLVVSHVLGGFV